MNAQTSSQGAPGVAKLDGGTLDSSTKIEDEKLPFLINSPGEDIDALLSNWNVVKTIGLCCPREAQSGNPGTEGYEGAPGSDGSSGKDITQESKVCENGGNGQDGGVGQEGGNGSRGCKGFNCPNLTFIVSGSYDKITIEEYVRFTHDETAESFYEEEIEEEEEYEEEVDIEVPEIQPSNDNESEKLQASGEKAKVDAFWKDVLDEDEGEHKSDVPDVSGEEEKNNEEEKSIEKQESPSDKELEKPEMPSRAKVRKVRLIRKKISKMRTTTEETISSVMKDTVTVKFDPGVPNQCIVIDARGGDGGVGGEGGKGGKGGHGGNGGNGSNNKLTSPASHCTVVGKGGLGGARGIGGKGGEPGDGGDSGDGGNVTIIASDPILFTRFVVVANPGKPGSPGNPGEGGEIGEPGEGGVSGTSIYIVSSNRASVTPGGKPGATGKVGSPGSFGRPGTVRYIHAKVNFNIRENVDEFIKNADFFGQPPTITVDSFSVKPYDRSDNNVTIGEFFIIDNLKITNKGDFGVKGLVPILNVINDNDESAGFTVEEVEANGGSDYNIELKAGESLNVIPKKIYCMRRSNPFETTIDISKINFDNVVSGSTLCEFQIGAILRKMNIKIGLALEHRIFKSEEDKAEGEEGLDEIKDENLDLYGGEEGESESLDSKKGHFLLMAPKQLAITVSPPQLSLVMKISDLKGIVDTLTKNYKIHFKYNKPLFLHANGLPLDEGNGTRCSYKDLVSSNFVVDVYCIIGESDSDRFQSKDPLATINVGFRSTQQGANPVVYFQYHVPGLIVSQTNAQCLTTATQPYNYKCMASPHNPQSKRKKLGPVNVQTAVISPIYQHPSLFPPAFVVPSVQDTHRKSLFNSIIIVDSSKQPPISLNSFKFVTVTNSKTAEESVIYNTPMVTTEDSPSQLPGSVQGSATHTPSVSNGNTELLISERYDPDAGKCLPLEDFDLLFNNTRQNHRKEFVSERSVRFQIDIALVYICTDQKYVEKAKEQIYKKLCESYCTGGSNILTKPLVGERDIKIGAASHIPYDLKTAFQQEQKLTIPDGYNKSQFDSYMDQLAFNSVKTMHASLKLADDFDSLFQHIPNVEKATTKSKSKIYSNPKEPISRYGVPKTLNVLFVSDPDAKMISKVERTVEDGDPNVIFQPAKYGQNNIQGTNTRKCQLITLFALNTTRLVSFVAGSADMAVEKLWDIGGMDRNEELFGEMLFNRRVTSDIDVFDLGAASALILLDRISYEEGLWYNHVVQRAVMRGKVTCYKEMEEYGDDFFFMGRAIDFVEKAINMILDYFLTDTPQFPSIGRRIITHVFSNNSSYSEFKTYKTQAKVLEGRNYLIIKSKDSDSAMDHQITRTDVALAQGLKLLLAIIISQMGTDMEYKKTPTRYAHIRNIVDRIKARMLEKPFDPKSRLKPVLIKMNDKFEGSVRCLACEKLGSEVEKPPVMYTIGSLCIGVFVRWNELVSECQQLWSDAPDMNIVLRWIQGSFLTRNFIEEALDPSQM